MSRFSYTYPPQQPVPPAAMATTAYAKTTTVGSIVATYQRLLREDPDLTMPIAAIEALVELLAHAQASTVSETMDLLQKSTDHLKSSIANPISLSAGTDLFQRYLINALQRPGSGIGFSGAGSGYGAGSGPVGDFRSIRQHLISNGRLFVTRSKASRDRIATFGRHFVRDGNTVLTNGASRVVGALLRHAAEDSHGSIRFRVIYVLRGGIDDDGTDKHTEGDRNRGAARGDAEGIHIVRSLRELGVPIAVIGEGAVGYAMGKVDMVIVGAEGVVENGGVISRLGTYQIGLLAKAARKPFYVVAESHKFVRLYPLSQYDLPIEQKVIDFKTSSGKRDGRGRAGTAAGAAEKTATTTKGTASGAELLDNIDFSLAGSGGDAKDKAKTTVMATGTGDAVDFTVSIFSSSIHNMPYSPTKPTLIPKPRFHLIWSTASFLINHPFSCYICLS